MTASMNIDDTPYAASAASSVEDDAMIEVADFDALFLRFHGVIRAYIVGRVGNYELAFDLTQDVFVKVYKALLSGTTIPRRAVASWLYRIASNTVIDMQRRQHPHMFLSLSLLNEEGGGEVSSHSPRFEELVADRQVIERVFKRMAPKYSVCLWLHKHAGLSGAQIGEMLHISESAAKMRLKRGRVQFITLYREEMGG